MHCKIYHILSYVIPSTLEQIYVNYNSFVRGESWTGGQV
jgi:hypothetical protein